MQKTLQNKRIKLWAHCVGIHGVRFSPEAALTELKKFHDSVHTETLDHNINSRIYDLREAGLVLAKVLNNAK